jgi:DNA-binding HxlR family transcriptional regulator
VTLMRKETSTNYINEEFLYETCELNSALSMISGRWKAQIVYSISKGNNRFTLLKTELPNISDQVLSRQLNELENHAILYKVVLPEFTPTRVEYHLTQKGRDVVPILEALCNWGKEYENKALNKNDALQTE